MGLDGRMLGAVLASSTWCRPYVEPAGCGSLPGHPRQPREAGHRQFNPAPATTTKHLCELITHLCEQVVLQAEGEEGREEGEEGRCHPRQHVAWRGRREVELTLETQVGQE